MSLRFFFKFKMSKSAVLKAALGCKMYKEIPQRAALRSSRRYAARRRKEFYLVQIAVIGRVRDDVSGNYSPSLDTWSISI